MRRRRGSRTSVAGTHGFRVWWRVCHSIAARQPSTPRFNDSVTSPVWRAYVSSFRTRTKDLHCSPQFVDAAQLAGQFGLTVDLCVRNHQIAEVTKLAELCPEGTFVLNHLGKPHVAAGQWTGWLHDIKAMAHLDPVRCKLSGLTTEAGEGTRGTNKIRRYLRAAVDAFGPDRCMFGSDWPKASLHISYAGWVSLVLDSVSDLGARERDRVMRGTALEVYARAWESR
jgi:predicted TIM-barrel fold metal-dependent hydrolase